jgi:hypothetical protein
MSENSGAPAAPVPPATGQASITVGPTAYGVPTTGQPPIEVIEKFECLKAKFVALGAQVRRLREHVLEMRQDLRENERRAAAFKKPPEGYALRRTDLERKISVGERELADAQAARDPLGRVVETCKSHLLSHHYNPDDPIPATKFVDHGIPGRGPVF